MSTLDNRYEPPRAAARDAWHELESRAARTAGALHVDSIRQRLGGLRERIAVRHSNVHRVGFALYDPREDSLTGVLGEPRGATAEALYARPLASVPSLAELARRHAPRVIDELRDELGGAASEASRWLLAQGFRASLTVPVFKEDELLGFLFFDSRVPAAFRAPLSEDLLLVADLLAVIVRQELASVGMLVGSLRLARQFAHLRDNETGSHIDRMASYAQLIAREIGPPPGRSQDFVDLLHLFAPLHDIGKVGVPDAILHKPGPLTAAERRVMDTHVPLGLEMAERLIADFDLQGLESVALLRNVIAHHHEMLDGSGYPGRLAGEDIPLEARIVATADVLDALSCQRSYKPAWTVSEALREVSRMAGRKLDADCVDALLACRDEVAAIHHAFHEPA